MAAELVLDAYPCNVRYFVGIYIYILIICFFYIVNYILNHNELYRTKVHFCFYFSWLRFGVWEAAKWVARVRDLSVYDPKRPILLNLTTDLVEENRYLQSKESALEATFLIKMMEY